MKRSIKQTIFSRPGLTGTAIGLSLVGATLGGVAQAQTPTPTGQNGAANFIQRLAQHLGVPQDKVTQALQDTRSDFLTDAVASGRMTQAEADRIRSRPVDQGPGFGLGFAGRGHGDKMRHGLRASFAVVAQRLGLTEADLKTQLASGQSLAEIAQAKGVSEQTVIDLLVNDAKTKMADAVKNGKLTQAQADQMLQKLPDRMKQLVESKHTPGSDGGTEDTDDTPDAND